MRPRAAAVDAMLMFTVLLWSLSVIATRYALAHGFAPIAFSALRQVASAAILTGICLRREGGLGIERRMLPLAALAILLGYVNQLFFVYAVRLGTASTVGMMLGTVPILTALIAATIGLERLSRRLAVAAGVSFAGVALVTVGVGGVDRSVAGVVLAFFTALSWASYSIAIATLTSRASALRISALVMLGFTPLLGATAAGQLASLPYGTVGWAVWACVASVAVGTALSTMLWFTGLERVGASHATLYANLQPFFVVVFGVLLLSEQLSPWTIAGGVAIGAGLVLAWRARSPTAVAVTVGVAKST